MILAVSPKALRRMLQELDVAARKAGLAIALTSDKSCWSYSKKWKGHAEVQSFMRLEAGSQPLCFMDTSQGLPLLGSSLSTAQHVPSAPLECLSYRCIAPRHELSAHRPDGGHVARMLQHVY